MRPSAARAQYQAPLYQRSPYPPAQMPAPAAAPTTAADNSVGQVATMQGNATVTRGNAAAAMLQVADPIFKNDTLATGADSALGVTFDDQTTFSLSADTRIVVNEFVYQEGGTGNAASFNVAIGTAAFVASLVAKTGDMKITTPDAAIGIRGTTGVVDVPAAGTTAAPTVKLYPDADGHVGHDRRVRPPGQPARRVDAGSERICDPRRRRRPDDRGALPNSAAGVGARPRRIAAAWHLAQYWPADAEPAAAIALAKPAKTE